MSIPAISWGSRRMPDPSWVAVDEYTLSHLHPPSKPNTKALQYAVFNSIEKGLPPIQTCPVQSKFIALHCKASKVQHVLEIGTLGAYTSIFIATENPGIHITSVEINPLNAKVARENIENAGVADRVTVIEGLAAPIMTKLLEEVEEGKRPRFGLTFIDADKLNNWAYFDLAVKLGGSGACVMVNCMVAGGELVNEESQNADHIKGARFCIENVGRDERVDAVVLQMVSEQSRDGFLMAVVR